MRVSGTQGSSQSSVHRGISTGASLVKLLAEHLKRSNSAQDTNTPQLQQHQPLQTIELFLAGTNNEPLLLDAYGAKIKARFEVPLRHSFLAVKGYTLRLEDWQFEVAFPHGLHKLDVCVTVKRYAEGFFSDRQRNADACAWAQNAPDLEPALSVYRKAVLKAHLAVQLQRKQHVSLVNYLKPGFESSAQAPQAASQAPPSTHLYCAEPLDARNMYVIVGDSAAAAAAATDGALPHASQDHSAHDEMRPRLMSVRHASQSSHFAPEESAFEDQYSQYSSSLPASLQHPSAVPWAAGTLRDDGDDTSQSDIARLRATQRHTQEDGRAGKGAQGGAASNQFTFEVRARDRNRDTGSAFAADQYWQYQQQQQQQQYQQYQQRHQQPRQNANPFIVPPPPPPPQTVGAQRAPVKKPARRQDRTARDARAGGEDNAPGGLFFDAPQSGPYYDKNLFLRRNNHEAIAQEDRKKKRVAYRFEPYKKKPRDPHRNYVVLSEDEEEIQRKHEERSRSRHERRHQNRIEHMGRNTYDQRDKEEYTESSSEGADGDSLDNLYGYQQKYGNLEARSDQY